MFIYTCDEYTKVGDRRAALVPFHALAQSDKVLQFFTTSENMYISTVLGKGAV